MASLSAYAPASLIQDAFIPCNGGQCYPIPYIYPHANGEICTKLTKENIQDVLKINKKAIHKVM